MTPGINPNINTKIEYSKVRKTLELDPKIFVPCQVKQFSLGIIRQRNYFVHFDGKKWDVLIISGDKIERLIFY